MDFRNNYLTLTKPVYIKHYYHRSADFGNGGTEVKLFTFNPQREAEVNTVIIGLPGFVLRMADHTFV